METAHAEGLFLGLACGDALGRPVEFKSASQIERKHGNVTAMLGNGTHNRAPGTITDDTEMALCIATSLADNGEFDPPDVAQRFIDWYESNPFDIGLMTADSIRQLKRGTLWDTAGKDVWEARREGQNAGNGSVMRCAPYAIAFADDSNRLATVSQQSSAITHADPRCTYGCVLLTRTLAGLLTNESRPLATALDEVSGDAPQELTEALSPIVDGDEPEPLRSSGYVVHTLQTSLYHGLNASSPREGILTAVNMGEDTDTVGAVTGAILGARFGAGELPADWCQALTVDTKNRTLPEWWPQTGSAEDIIRDLARALAKP